MDPVSPETLSPLVAAAYDLGKSVTCDWLSSGLNDVFQVTAGEAVYILKVYRAGWRTQAEVLEEIAALRHLDGKGVSVALPIARRDGASVWALPAPSGERQVVLYAHTQGREVPAPDEGCCRRFGKTLAELHNAADDFSAAPVRYDLENLLNRPLRELEPFLDDRPDDHDFLRGLAGRLRNRIEGLPPGALDWGYCHGDFRSANLHVDEATGAVTVFDFELGGMGYRAYDIGYTLTNIHHLARELLWRAPALQYAEESWTAFLDGYAAHRRLHAAARDAIPLFAAMRAVQIMGTLLRTARLRRGQETWPPTEGGGLPGGDLFDRALRFLRAWEVDVDLSEAHAQPAPPGV